MDRDKQTEFVNRGKREQISLRRKLVISFNWGKINVKTKNASLIFDKHFI